MTLTQRKSWYKQIYLRDKARNKAYKRRHADTLWKCALATIKEIVVHNRQGGKEK